MSYVINKTNGAQVTVVADGTIDNTLDIKLLGKNYGGYGEVQNENFVFMLENFANNTPPTKPLLGQLWFDSTNKKLKYFDSTTFRGLGSIDVSATAPSTPILGDFWYNITSKQLKVFNGSTFSLIGPQRAGTGVTEMVSVEVIDTLGNPHAIIEAVVNDVVVFIISKDPVFTLDDSINAIDGFSKIYQGVTVANTTDVADVIKSDPTGYKYNGTSTDSDHLGGFASSDYIRNKNPIELDYITEFSSAGFTVGSTNDLKVYIDGSTPVIGNQVGNNIEFRTTISSNTTTKLQLVGNNVLPGNDNTTDLGSSPLKYKKLYVYEIDVGLINGGIPFSLASGTRLLFAQSSAPIGWVQITGAEADDRMLRVVSGSSGINAGGYSGGSHSPILMNVVPNHNHTFSGTVAELSHTHSMPTGGNHEHLDVALGGSSGWIGGGNGAYPFIHQTLTGGLHSHAIDSAKIFYTPAGVVNSNSGNNWQPKYLNLILCEKT